MAQAGLDTLSSDVPVEFTPEAVAAVPGGSLYADVLDNGEPYRSLLKYNPWMRVPSARDPLVWGEGRYYDTTVARKHAYWHDKNLPTPTRDLVQMRDDMDRFGFCLIRDGVSPTQCARLRERVAEQAAAERSLGIAHVSPAQQHVWALVNKGEVFERCMEHDPAAVQAGPLIERLMDELLGPGWNHLSFIANISFPDCHPQGLHQDQGFLLPFAFHEAPALINTIYILQDVDDRNGGTLLIPGTHRANGTGGERFGPLPTPINLEAPAGTILIMDGRVLHGGGVNRSDSLRYIITNSVVKPWVKQQENFLLTVRPEVLARASDKFLYRAGFLATSTRNMVEGYGYTGSGRMADPNGSLVHVRRAYDAGAYRHVGPLTRQSVERMQGTEFTLGRIQIENETQRDSDYFRDLLKRCDDRAQNAGRTL